MRFLCRIWFEKLAANSGSRVHRESRRSSSEGLEGATESFRRRTQRSIADGTLQATFPAHSGTPVTHPLGERKATGAPLAKRDLRAEAEKARRLRELG